VTGGVSPPSGGIPHPITTGRGGGRGAGACGGRGGTPTGSSMEAPAGPTVAPPEPSRKRKRGFSNLRSSTSTLRP
jgi:hypothetical protein